MLRKPFLISGAPLHGWLGFVMVILFWALNWGLPGLRTHWGFIFLWLGYCLLIDGMVYSRRGSSLLTRSGWGYLFMFIISAGAWWLFEVINWRTQNWFYDGRQYFTDLEYFLLASLSFSTVIPAVFGTAEFFSTLGWVQGAKKGWKIKPTPGTLRFFLFSGLLMLALLWLWPRYFFPLVWLSVYFILAPINVWLGYPSLSRFTEEGDWRPVYALWLGALTCGFFWEMWNFYSYPKWIYQVPFVDFWHVFEMPVLGYGGYLPFALELFALYNLAVGLLALGRKNYLQFG